jgi:hypothetical protein
MSDLPEKLKQIVAETYSKLKKFDKAEVLFKVKHDKWSKQEILGHLIDSALNNHRRFVLGQWSANLIIEGYQQNRWVVHQVYQDGEWIQLLDLWKNLNLHIAHVIETMPDDILNKKFSEHNLDQIMMYTLPDPKTASLLDLFHDYIIHLQHHLKQILE